MNAIATRATHEYLTRVRTSLADIPAAEVDDLLDDVRPHLADIATEIGPDCTLPDMIARLGTPEQYAAELRSAGDYPAAPVGPVAPQRRPRLALWSMLASSFFLLWAAVIAISNGDASVLYAGIALCGGVIGLSAVSVVRRGTQRFEELPEVLWLRESYDSPTGRYLKSLAPGWWIGAGFIFVGSALLLTRQRGEAALALPIFAILAGLIIFAGLRVGRNRAWLWATIPLSAIAIGSVLGVPVALSESARYDYAGDPMFMSGLTQDGRPVTNVYGFTPDGKPISEFYLVDQDGHPINVAGMQCGPYGAQSANPDNAFPKKVVTDDGQCKESSGTPFTVAIPQSSTPSTTTTSVPTTTLAPTTTVEPAPTP